MPLTVIQKYLRAGTSRKAFTFCKKGFKKEKNKNMFALFSLDCNFKEKKEQLSNKQFIVRHK